MPATQFAHVDPSPPSAAGGPLGGKTVAIQPNLSVRGWPTEAGSTALERFVAVEDATAVQRLRAAGATLVGSARMAELGFGLAGDAMAEALTDCDVALITDTMGEARHTAATAAAFGLKPSYGIVSRFGLIGLVPSMECLGVAARSASDVAAVMAALAGPDERDPSMRGEEAPDFAGAGETPSMPVAGTIRECTSALEPEEAEAFRAAVARLEAAGLRTEEVSLPDYDLLRVVHNLVGAAEASSAAGKYDSVRYGHRAAGAENWNAMYLASRAESFGPLVKSYLFQGAYVQFEDYPAFENACRIRRRLVRQTDALFETVGVLVLPTRRAGADAAAAASVDEVYDAFALTLAANVTGHPALTVPGLVRDGDADLGLQLIGPPLADARLLGLGARLAGLAP